MANTTSFGKRMAGYHGMVGMGTMDVLYGKAPGDHQAEFQRIEPVVAAHDENGHAQ